MTWEHDKLLTRDWMWRMIDLICFSVIEPGLRYNYLGTVHSLPYSTMYGVHAGLSWGQKDLIKQKSLIKISNSLLAKSGSLSDILLATRCRSE